MTAVRARQLVKTFGEVVALDGVDLDIIPGRVHGVIGPNGAGKTTLLGLLLGLVAPDEGELVVLGQQQRPGSGVPQGVSGFVDAPGLYPTLGARENLAQLAQLHGRRRTDPLIDELLDEVGLAEVAGERVRGFSLGMRQRLGLAAAMLTQPRLLVLDEASNGLDPAGRQTVHRVLTGLAAQGTAIVLTSHRMDDLARLCDAVTLLSAGRVAFSGTVAELADQAPADEYRLVTSNQLRTSALARLVPGLSVRGQAAPLGTTENQELPTDGALVLTGDQAALDRLVTALVEQRISLRELAPTVPPLEAAFLRLVGADRGGQQPPPQAASQPPAESRQHRTGTVGSKAAQPTGATR